MAPPPPHYPPQAYGYEHLISLHHLETAGLLRLQGDKRVFPQLRKQLKLIPDTVDDKVSG